MEQETTEVLEEVKEKKEGCIDKVKGLLKKHKAKATFIVGVIGGSIGGCYMASKKFLQTSAEAVKEVAEKEIGEIADKIKK